jgi:tyrosine-protein kinase Etk/Wzc
MMENPKMVDRMAPLLEPEGLTFKLIKSKVLQNWKWFVVFSIAGVFTAFVYYKMTPQYYNISSTILVKGDQKSSDLNNVFREINVTRSNPTIQDQVGVLKSYNLNFRTLQYFDWRYTWYRKDLFVTRDLYGNDPFEVIQPSDAIQFEGVPVTVRPVSDNEYTLQCDKKVTMKGIEYNIEFKEQVKFGEVFKNEYFHFGLKKKVDMPVTSEDEFILVFNNINQLALKYKEDLKVSPVDIAENSNLISIELVTNKLARDVDYVNQLGKVYIQFGLDEKNRIANNTIKFIDDQITGVDRSLQLAGDQFSSFRTRNRTVDLGTEATSVVEKLKGIETERSNLELKLDYYNNLKFYLENRDQNKDLVAPSIVGVTDESLNARVLKLNELYTRREVLSYTAQERNPVLISLNNEINFAQKGLSENVENLIANTRVELQSLNERQRSVNSELSKLPKTEQDLIGIKRNFDLNNELYTFLLQRRAEAEIAKASNNPDAQILDPTDSEIAVLLGPKLFINVGVGLFGGLFLALGFVVIKEFTNERLTSIEEITNKLDVAIVGSIAINKYKVETPVYHHPRSALTESFRGLRVNLEHFFKATGGKVLALHSHISGEGKSFVAVNLAMIFAMSNKKVLLLDADLRKPRLHRILHIENEYGLSTYLSGEKSADEVIYLTDIKNLHVVTTGNVNLNSFELLNNGMIKTFIETVKDGYDLIIIDNSPFGVIYDPIIVGANADFNLVLLRLNYSKKDEIDAVNKVGNDGILKKVMVAVNGIKQGKGYGYYKDDAMSEPKESLPSKEVTPSIPEKIKAVVSFQRIPWFRSE